MSKRVGYFIILYWLSSLGVCLGQSSPEINYTIEDGLPSNTVYDVIQDDRGYMWFGTDAGLSRFDGYEFKNYSLDDGLPDVEILKFFKDSQGRIWMHTYNGKVGYLQGNSIFSSQNQPELATLDFQSRITSILEINGAIYFSDRKFGIKRLSIDGTISSRSHPNLHSGYLCYCNDQLFWFLREFRPETDASGYFTAENSMIVSFKHGANLDPTPIDKDLNEFSLGSLGYLYCYQNKIVTHQFSLEADYLTFLDSKSLKVFNSKRIEQQGVRILSLEQQGNRLLAFASSGVFEYNEQENNLIHVLNVDECSTSFTDDEGNQWISTLANGVLFRARSPIKKVDIPVKRVGKLQVYRDQLYLLHNQKSLSVLRNDFSLEKVFEFPLDLSFSYLSIQGDTALVAANEAVFLVDLKARRLIKQFNIFATAAYETDEHWLFAGLYARIVRIRRDNLLMDELPFPIQRVHDLLPLRSDSILIASDNGLQVYTGEEDPYPFRESFPEIRVSKIIRNGDQLWMTTSGQGVLKYGGDSIQRFSYPEGMKTNLFKEIMLAKDGVWVSTSASLNKINLTTGKIIEVSSRDGLDDSNVNDMIVHRNRLFLAQENGLFYFPADENFEESSDFHLYIDEVTAKNDMLNIKNRVGLPHDIGPIKLTVKAPVYKHKASLIFQYRLIDESAEIPNWNNTNLNQFNFSGLSPGSYGFEVRGKTKNSDWTSPATFNFQIIPAYWQTLWFRILIASMIGLLSGLIFYTSTKNNRLKRKLDKDRIAAEIKALKAQINPHFLFNALNSIQFFLLSNENELAEEYLAKYSKLMRRILDQSSLLTNYLHEELKTIQLYVDLEKYRLSNEFEFHIRIEEGVDPEVKIPSMILQPFIENAIWHGVTNRKDGKIELIVKKAGAQSIVLEVTDNGAGFDPKKVKNSSKGSSLVQDRLALLNQMEGIKSQLVVNSQFNQGTQIKILVSGITT